MAILRVVEISGGVGGARLGRGLDRIGELDLTIVVNVGDDDDIHGLHVSPDLDTVMYTLAGIEGPAGWGRAGDTFETNNELGALGVDNRFRLGDKDMALNIIRTQALRSGVPLSAVTKTLSQRLGIRPDILPATDSNLRTTIETKEGETLSFQEYFVLRQHRDDVESVTYVCAEAAKPAPGVIESIDDADLVVIGPSNPPLSIWPILSIPGIKDAIARHHNVLAISPLFGGKALKGPASQVMHSLGLHPGTRGVAQAYDGLIGRLVVDVGDSNDVGTIGGVEVIAMDTRIIDPMAAARFAKMLVQL